MRRLTKPTPALRRAPQQIDLFAGEPQKTIGNMPAWSALPTEIQAALQLDNTVDPGACRQEPDWLDGGGRS